MILLIDNYDSFAHNLARYFRRLGQEVVVLRNDEVDLIKVKELAPQALVLSPGPCTPNEAGCSLELVHALYKELPMLGICLGHQTVAAALGATIVRARVPMHGRTSLVEHRETELFLGLPQTFNVCRYHSLVVDPGTLPDELQITATCDDGTIMALRHRQYRVFGLQFHPEAILTEHGYELLANFLHLAGLGKQPSAVRFAASECLRPALSRQPLPAVPVTF